MQSQICGQQNGVIITSWDVDGTEIHLRHRQGRSRVYQAPTERQAVKGQEGRAIVCRNCRQTITDAESLFSFDGSRTHTFFNPAGIIFEIICFSKAPGCVVHGPASTEFCWFSGFTWRLAFCGNCLAHLGWLFESVDSSFFGLILKKLIGEV